MSAKEQKRLAVLQRRAAHLKERIDANPDKDLSFDVQERNALLWAMRRIEEMEKGKAA